MPDSHDTLCLDSFYPETELKITEIQQDKVQILIRMKSISNNCKCPKCGCITNKYHGTYIRKVQDLPILGKRVQLEICSHEYKFLNNECDVTTIAETFDGFLNIYSRMTERCADFICTLAMETSCEGCARICKALGIKISGDTVIRLLLKKYGSLPVPKAGEVICVDDFAYKKRHTYGTIIVNEKTHEPVTLLDGRNGTALQDWLKNHKNIKVVTRDRIRTLFIAVIRKFGKSSAVLKNFEIYLENEMFLCFTCLQKNMEIAGLEQYFVEGTNNRLKTIKRTMYGRCGKELLTAKLIYMSKRSYG